MKKILTAMLFLALTALLWQLYQLYLQNRTLRDTLSAVSGKVDNFKKENLQFQADLEYFQEPENLEKELRSRFNYKNPGEKLIIIVSPKDNEN